METVSGNFYSKKINPNHYGTDVLPSTVRSDGAFGSAGGFESGTLLMGGYSCLGGFGGYSTLISQLYTNLLTSVLSQTIYYSSVKTVANNSLLTSVYSILTFP
jgi:hypothetical protein